jgi:hypothetical protein
MIMNLLGKMIRKYGDKESGERWLSAQIIDKASLQ